VKELWAQFERSKSELLEKSNQQTSKCSDCCRRHSADQATPIAASEDTASDVTALMSQAEVLRQEASSLKVVLELRNGEISKLKLQNIENEKQLHGLTEAKTTIVRLQQKLENAEALVNLKNDYDRELVEKHNVVLRKLDKESKVNKKLSMDNEQLEWRLSNAIISTSPDITGRPMDFTSTQITTKGRVQQADTTQSKSGTEALRSSLGSLGLPTKSAPNTPRFERRRRVGSTSKIRPLSGTFDSIYDDSLSDD